MEMKDLKKTLERMFPEARIVKGDGYWSVVTDDGFEETSESYTVDEHGVKGDGYWSVVTDDGFEETSESYTVDDHGRLVNFAVSIVEI